MRPRKAITASLNSTGSGGGSDETKALLNDEQDGSDEFSLARLSVRDYKSAVAAAPAKSRFLQVPGLISSVCVQALLSIEINETSNHW